MFNVEDLTWISKSSIAAHADAEITFSLNPTYHPDPNSLDETKAIALPALTMTSATSSMRSSKDFLDNEQGLIDHYKAVLKLARHFGHSYNNFEHHMWLRLRFSSHEGALEFPWYDKLDAMDGIFDWIRDAANGDVWSDVEQGWEMVAVRVGERFHFRQGRFDQGDEEANVALPRQELLDSISALRERMALIFARLTAALGEDYWTRHRYDLHTDLK